MDLTSWEVRLGHRELRKKSFLLGNKRAFSLSLPVAEGSSRALQHPHKWFGAYLYGRKFLEGQVVRVLDRREKLLSERVQSSFTMGPTSARREYDLGDRACSEEFFVPDGIQGIACLFEGACDLVVEPELDLRFSSALNQSCDHYQVESLTDGVLVSAPLPSGRYDDATETYVPDAEQFDAGQLWAAVQVVGEQAWAEILPPARRTRRKRFPQDRRRGQLVLEMSHDAADHAPMWNEYSSRVYAPVRLHIHGVGCVIYGFGVSREEALNQMSQLRDNLIPLRAQKLDSTRALLEHSPLSTGSDAVDLAYVHVLGRLMDALVARHAVADDTVLDRPATMILAGNQYFHDSWKRDENIALGFLLALGFYDLARDVIRDTWQLQDEASGRLPQRIRAGEQPAYHSSDGTLWALVRLHQYWRCSGDKSLLHEKLPMVERFFERSLERVVDGMLPSGRTTDRDYLWETWMDTHHTPRHGFPIEIQMLWITALQSFGPTIGERNPELELSMARAEHAAREALGRFNVRGVPADSLDEQGIVRDLITPNAYFCFGLGLDLGTEIESAMRSIGRRHLAGSHGIRTLAPLDWERVFSPEFLADRRHVRGSAMRSVGKLNYHRGVEWNWLSRFFVEAELKYGDSNRAYRTYLRPHVESVLTRNGIGGISELHDLSGARGPDFQAWSMSSFLEAIHAFAGVHIDVPAGRIVVEPQLPAAWPHLNLRKWYGRIPLDLSVEGGEHQRTFRLTAPWGEAPEAEIEIALLLPPRARPEAVEILVDGNPCLGAWSVERIDGADRSRVRLSIPAHREIEVRLSLAQRAPRLEYTA